MRRARTLLFVRRARARLFVRRARAHTHTPTLPPPPQNSLVMASIEARMKRLDSLAHKACVSLSTLEEQQSSVSQSEPAASVCLGSPLALTVAESETHHMPEWKFFDKVCWESSQYGIQHTFCESIVL